MKKFPLCLTAVICFSLLNVATADPVSDCISLGQNKQFSEAVPVCQEACNLNDALACEGMGYLYYKGKGVKQDIQKGIMYYKKACNLKDRIGCFILGDIYENAKGVSQSFQTAKEYYGKACDLGNETGCLAYQVLNEKGY